MAVLLHEFYDLEEKAAKNLKAWKVWHLILFTTAASFGILNYIFLFNTMRIVNDNCVLFPRKLEFHLVDIANKNENISNNSRFPTYEGNVTKRNIIQHTSKYNKTTEVTQETETSVVVNNVTVLTENTTHHLVLDTTRTLFGNDDCQYVQYMPIFSTIFAIIWICMFTMCPGGGKSRSGLQQPWRILAPAMFFSLLFVGLTGYSFTTTNRGIHSFCAAFYEYTNATTCSSVDPYIELARYSWLGFGGWTAATRAASAGVWASWACASALLLARCLAAPDFNIKKTSVYLKDPQKILIPHLRKSKRKNAPNNKTPIDTTEFVKDAVVTDPPPDAIIVASVTHH